MPSLFDDSEANEIPESEESEPAFSEEIVDDDLSAQFDKVSAAFGDDELEEEGSEFKLDDTEELENNVDEVSYALEEEPFVEEDEIENKPGPASASDLHTLFGYNSEENDEENNFDSSNIFEENFTGRRGFS